MEQDGSGFLRQSFRTFARLRSRVGLDFEPSLIRPFSARWAYKRENERGASGAPLTVSPPFLRAKPTPGFHPSGLALLACCAAFHTCRLTIAGCARLTP
jgi:hypothetical protein